MRIVLLIIILNLNLFAEIETVPWGEKKAEGWIYFEENKKQNKPSIPKQKEHPPKVQKPERPTSHKLTNREKLKRIKEDLEEKLASAILIPSYENIEAYIKAQQRITRSSERFAHNWQQVLLLNPELDPNFTNPTNQFGLAIKKQQENIDNQAKLKELEKKHFLFFFIARIVLFLMGWLQF